MALHETSPGKHATTSYRLLVRTEGVAALLMVSLVARLPVGFYSLAILLWVRAVSGSFAIAGAATAAFSISRAVAAPLQGALVDRLGQTRVLTPMAFGQAVAIASAWAAARAGAEIAVVVAVAFAGALIPPLAGCLRALWPIVCGDPSNTRLAYALDAISQETIWIVGPLILAGVIAVASPGDGVIVAAVGTLAGTYMFAKLQSVRAWSPAPGHRRVGRALRDARIWWVLGSSAWVGCTWGCLLVGLAASAPRIHERGVAPILVAVVSAGSIGGGLAYTRVAASRRAPAVSHRRQILVACSVAEVPLVFANSLWLLLLGSLIAGLPFAAFLGNQYTLIGEAVPGQGAVEAFTWHNALFGGGVAIGAAAAGAVVSANATAAFALAAAASAVAALTAGRKRLGRAPDSAARATLF